MTTPAWIAPTRWHPDDLIKRIFDQSADRWEPAPDDDTGDTLWPERFPHA